MTKYKIDKNLEIVCEYKKTRNAFKHEATLLKDGYEIESTKKCYSNRTWERFEFESVIKKLLDKTKIITERRKTNFIERISGESSKKTSDSLKAIGNIAKLGEIFSDTKKGKNDWKEKMIKIGLGNKGLIMPEDWNELSENEKERRLNGVVKMLQN